MISSDPDGKLAWRDEQGVRHPGLVPVRAFPLSAPQAEISLVDVRGHERLWIADLAALSETERRLVEAALDERDLLPEILAITQISSESVPSVWWVRTDHGDTQLELKGEEDIRRLEHGGLLITASSGLGFVIPDLRRLDRASRRRLERFL